MAAQAQASRDTNLLGGTVNADGSFTRTQMEANLSTGVDRTQPNIFNVMGRTIDVNQALQLETGADFQGILKNLNADELSAADRYDSATERVDLYMSTFNTPGGRVQRNSGVEGVMSADQILDLYKIHTHSKYASNVQDARLKHLQAQVNRDIVSSQRIGLSSFLTGLFQDMNRIRSSSLSDYFSQLFRILGSDNRPFAFGMFFVFVGLLSMALARINT